MAGIKNFGADRTRKRMDVNDTSEKPCSKRRKKSTASVNALSPLDQRYNYQNLNEGKGFTVIEERIAVQNLIGFERRLKATSSVISIDDVKNDNKSAQIEQHNPGPVLPHSLDDPLLRFSLESNGLQQCERPEGWIGAYSQDRRRLRIERFLAKRSQRVWTKTILNNVRGDSADKRRCVKGQFVKNESMNVRKSNPETTTSTENTNRSGGITINKPRGTPKTGTSCKGGLAARMETDEKRREREDKKRERQEKKVKQQQEKKAAAVASSLAQQQQYQHYIPGSRFPHSLDDPLLRFSVDAKDLHQCKRPDGWIGAYSPASRRVRLERFLAKRLQRVWTNTVIYDGRKNFADIRLRVKGRCIKKEDELMMPELISLT